jgi:hypothetical protein
MALVCHDGEWHVLHEPVLRTNQHRLSCVFPLLLAQVSISLYDPSEALSVVDHVVKKLLGRAATAEHAHLRGVGMVVFGGLVFVQDELDPGEWHAWVDEVELAVFSAHTQALVCVDRFTHEALFVCACDDRHHGRAARIVCEHLVEHLLIWESRDEREYVKYYRCGRVAAHPLIGGEVDWCENGGGVCWSGWYTGWWIFLWRW